MTFYPIKTGLDIWLCIYKCQWSGSKPEKISYNLASSAEQTVCERVCVCVCVVVARLPGPSLVQYRMTVLVNPVTEQLAITSVPSGVSLQLKGVVTEKEW